MMPTGDESYTKELADMILHELESGKGLNAICTPESPFPHRTTVLGWVRDNVDGFANRYARAREDGYRALADEILSIADDGRNDTYETENGTMTNHEIVQRSKLRIDARKWLLAKMLPKEYGDRVDVTSGGEKIDGPAFNIAAVPLANLQQAEELLNPEGKEPNI